MDVHSQNNGLAVDMEESSEDIFNYLEGQTPLPEEYIEQSRQAAYSLVKEKYQDRETVEEVGDAIAATCLKAAAERAEDAFKQLASQEAELDSEYWLELFEANLGPGLLEAYEQSDTR